MIVFHRQGLLFRLIRGRGLTAARLSRHLFRFLAIPIRQVARQIGLLDTAQGGLVVHFQAAALQGDVGADTLGLDRTSGRGVIEGGGEFKGAGLVDGDDGLHRALAEGLGTHDDGPFMILQGAGDDLGGGGGAGIHQHHQGRAGQHVIGTGLELQGRVRDPPLGIDDEALGEEGIADGDGTVEHPAGIVAQVQHQALEVPLVFGAQAGEGVEQVLGGTGLEIGDAHIAEARRQEAALDALHMNDIPNQFHLEGLIRARAQDSEFDGGTRLPPHEIDGVLQAHALHRTVVNAHDQIPRLESGPLGRGVIDR